MLLSEWLFDGLKNLVVRIKDVKASSNNFQTEFDKYNVIDQFRYSIWSPSEGDKNPALTFEFEKNLQFIYWNQPQKKAKEQNDQRFLGLFI